MPFHAGPTQQCPRIMAARSSGEDREFCLLAPLHSTFLLIRRFRDSAGVYVLHALALLALLGFHVYKSNAVRQQRRAIHHRRSEFSILGTVRPGRHRIRPDGGRLRADTASTTTQLLQVLERVDLEPVSPLSPQERAVIVGVQHRGRGLLGRLSQRHGAGRKRIDLLRRGMGDPCSTPRLLVVQAGIDAPPSRPSTTVVAAAQWLSVGWTVT